MADVVYALHDFDAENPDELSFGAGEVIVVLERDGQYGDGWFSVRRDCCGLLWSELISLILLAGPQHPRRNRPLPSVLHVAVTTLAAALSHLSQLG